MGRMFRLQGNRERRSVASSSTPAPLTVQEARQRNASHTIYLLKLNLGYQMLFFTRMVKFSDSCRNAGLQNNRKSKFHLYFHKQDSAESLVITFSAFPNSTS